MQHPNGTGRFLEAVTPEGMTSGSTFYVKASMKPVGPTPVCSTPEEIKEPKRDYKKLKALIEAWLEGKATILAGGESENLNFRQ